MTTTPNPEQMPDGFSMAELQKMMEQAKPEERQQKEGPYKGFTESEVIALAEELMVEADQKLSHPILAKVVMHMILARMIEWHSQAGVHVAKSSGADNDSYVCWLRDAGKFQAMLATLSSISVCDNDFTTER